MMELCPLVEGDKKGLAIKGPCIPQARNFFSQSKKINGRLICPQVFSESNLHSPCYATPLANAGKLQPHRNSCPAARQDSHEEIPGAATAF